MLSVAFKKPVSLHTGRIQLTKDQAATRADRVQKVMGDVYDIIAPVQFKAGEVFGLETIPKPWRPFLVKDSAPPEPPPPPPKRLIREGFKIGGKEPKKVKPKRKPIKRKKVS